MATAYSLHIGVTDYRHRIYATVQPNEITGCIRDMETMAEIAKQAGIENVCCLDDPTDKEFDACMKDIIDKVEEGDLFLFTYAGHGLKQESSRVGRTEDYDQAICLKNKIVWDNELNGYFRSFGEDVRIVAVFDSCYSRTAYSLLPPSIAQAGMFLAKEGFTGMLSLYRRFRTSLTGKRASGRAPDHKKGADSGGGTARALLGDFYDRYPAPSPVRGYKLMRLMIRHGAPWFARPKNRIDAVGVAMSAASDVELAYESDVYTKGVVRGHYTSAFHKVFGGGTFRGTYQELHERILEQRDLLNDQFPFITSMETNDTVSSGFYLNEQFLQH